MSDEAAQARIDRLLDAIDLIKADQRDEALRLLRQLVHDHADFEAAWLWMSVTVESLDLSSICLDNVLRVNPDNAFAAAALARIRQREIAMQRRRARLSLYRDAAWVGMWGLTLALLYAMLFAYFT
jgi:hypothetical protein